MPKDPIKEIIETKDFKIFVWDSKSITVSFKNQTVIFRDLEEVKDINKVTEALIKNMG